MAGFPVYFFLERKEKMEKRLAGLYKEVDALLNIAPAEGDCTDAENLIYAEMANLKNALFDAGFDPAFYAEEKEAAPNEDVIFGVSIVCSQGFDSGRESAVYLYDAKEKCFDEMYEKYQTFWSHYEEEEMLEDSLDDNGNGMLTKEEFIFDLEEFSYVLIQLTDFHVQFEYFEEKRK